jgi:DNA polymerase-3 subunit epsilon
MPRLLVFDTETGGIDPDAHSLLDLGATVWEDGITTADFQVFVAEPCLRVTADAMAINEINLETHRERAVPPAEALARLHAFVTTQFKSELAAGEKVVLVGHNVAFDIGFLKRLYRDCAGDFEALYSHRAMDTAGIIRFLGLAGMLSLPGAGLEGALSYFNIQVPPKDRHTALGDAKATAILLNRLLETVRGPRVQNPHFAETRA